MTIAPPLRTARGLAAGFVLATALLGWSGLAQGHALLLRLEDAGTAIEGVAYYTNGTPAAGERVELLRPETGTAVLAAMLTAPDGRFRFEGLERARYRVVAHGEEGHLTELEIALGSGAAPRLIDTEAAAGSPLWPPPPWAVLGLLLLGSLVPAVLMRRRSPGK